LGFYIFGAITLFFIFVTDPLYTSSLVTKRHGLPPTTGPWILPATAVLGLVIAWGLFSLSRWGYLLTVAYLIYFGSTGLYLSRGQITTIDFGNFIWSLFVIIYLIMIRKQFFARSPKGG
jgi:uncharacterized membrane protein (DUF2068 family)